MQLQWCWQIEVVGTLKHCEMVLKIEFYTLTGSGDAEKLCDFPQLLLVPHTSHLVKLSLPNTSLHFFLLSSLLSNMSLHQSSRLLADSVKTQCSFNVYNVKIQICSPNGPSSLHNYNWWIGKYEDNRVIIANHGWAGCVTRGNIVYDNHSNMSLCAITVSIILLKRHNSRVKNSKSNLCRKCKIWQNWKRLSVLIMGNTS